jgi:acetolactate synthase-1/2/3 large subunit
VSAAASRNGGQILVEALKIQGVDRVYCVPGESYLPVLDALYDYPEIAVVSARHEGAAANMAEADGKLTGRPGICMVTRGPGATHASIGVHTAFQDSTPMILFIGQVAADARDREGFQEVDYRAMFAPLAKWVAEIDDAARIPEYVARAFAVATAGRAGPVVLSLPEDMLSSVIEAPKQARANVAQRAGPVASDLAALRDKLVKTERPLLIVGGSGWDEEARQSLLKFAQRNYLPIVASFRRQDVIDNRLDNYCGHLGLGVDPKLAKRLVEADLIVSIGSRLGENTTGGYDLLKPPALDQDFVHVHPDPEELGRVYQPSLAFPCDCAEFAKALTFDLPASEKRQAWLREAREAYVAFSTPAPVASNYVDLGAVMAWLSANVDEDAIVANGAGNYTVWLHRFFRYKRPRTELAPTSGAMGYGLPAAIAAKLRHPKRQVVAFAGDGCFLMYPQELGTAVQHNANLIVIVVNNATYGTIRMHQERRFPGRVIATSIVTPNFVAMAESFGLAAKQLTSADQFPEAFGWAEAQGRPVLLELMTDPLQSTPSFRLPA